MTFAPLALGTTADPIVVPSAGQKTDLLSCGPLDLSLVNGLLKLLGDRIDAVDAADNAILSAIYDAGTNDLTFTMSDGPVVVIPLDDVIADAVATAITGATLPTGIITLWSGGAVPGGWALCDGTGGTPDLRDRFIVGAGGAYASGATGGALTHDHAITVSPEYTGITIGTTTTQVNADADPPNALTSANIIDPGHTHLADAALGSSLPPYYALAYIMKI